MEILFLRLTPSMKSSSSCEPGSTRLAVLITAEDIALSAFGILKALQLAAMEEIEGPDLDLLVLDAVVVDEGVGEVLFVLLLLHLYFCLFTN